MTEQWRANLVLACPRCNQRKHTKLPQEFAGRLF
jgi:5-methylcytosine-specific restriction endonuclease McrA